MGDVDLWAVVDATGAPALPALAGCDAASAADGAASNGADGDEESGSVDGDGDGGGGGSLAAKAQALTVHPKWLTHLQVRRGAFGFFHCGCVSWARYPLCWRVPSHAACSVCPTQQGSALRAKWVAGHAHHPTFHGARIPIGSRARVRYYSNFTNSVPGSMLFSVQRYTGITYAIFTWFACCRTGCWATTATRARPRPARTRRGWAWCWNGCMAASWPRPKRRATAPSARWAASRRPRSRCAAGGRLPTSCFTGVLRVACCLCSSDVSREQ